MLYVLLIVYIGFVNFSVDWSNQEYAGGAILKSVSTGLSCLHPKV